MIYSSRAKIEQSGPTESEEAYEVIEIGKGQSYVGRNQHMRRKLNNLPKPILELPRSYFPTSMGFFSVGSKIYMVGGGEITFGLKDSASRRCYVLDACDDPIYRIRDVPPMNCEKLRPIVLGPLKGKFYVLDQTLASGDLEEFDPKTESWTLLPPPPIIPLVHVLNILRRSLMITRTSLLPLLRTKFFSQPVKAYLPKKWAHWSSLGGEVEFPFRKQSVLMDGFWYAFPSIYRSLVLAFSFDWDKGFRELGVMLPSWLGKYEAAGIMVPMGNKIFTQQNP
ncbi:hypothetical protein RHMOL_Rhmol04G0361700 [Rhododendron molle]|uniref:Uncharacterized protein n=1 Tax=Rhododendron molle TaxID=49168 RepID=A0ACC0P965_RHOML|nr:hypothetical protein RHMOL_Rhmol04G0361700 [Rhododendron molle]